MNAEITVQLLPLVMQGVATTTIAIVALILLTLVAAGLARLLSKKKGRRGNTRGGTVVRAEGRLLCRM